jgi:hypothetical protein
LAPQRRKTRQKKKKQFKRKELSAAGAAKLEYLAQRRKVRKEIKLPDLAFPSTRSGHAWRLGARYSDFFFCVLCALCG